MTPFTTIVADPPWQPKDQLPGPYLELFARRDRPGWTTVGLECPSTEGEDIFASIDRLTDEVTAQRRLFAPARVAEIETEEKEG